MRALVTGGAGFIGSALAGALLQEGWDVRVLDNFATGREENVPEGAELTRGDIRDAETTREACSGIDVVFHQAAIRSVPKSVDDPLLSETSNVLGTLNVLMAAEGTGVKRVVYASSSSAYGETSEPVNREDATPHPASPYAVSKLAAEYYCGVWTRIKGLSTVSLRYFNVFGPGQRPDSKYAAVFPAFIAALTAKQPPEVHWDGEQSRDFTFVHDVVRANIMAASADKSADGQVVNIGGGGAKSINEVLAEISTAMGVWIEPNRSGKRAGDIRSTNADISRARELLGWKPEAEWSDAVKKTVNWFQESVLDS